MNIPFIPQSYCRLKDSSGQRETSPQSSISCVERCAYRASQKHGPSELIRLRYFEAAGLFFSSRKFCINSPIKLLHLYRTVPSRLFDRIRSLEVIFCSSYAKPTTAINQRTRWNFIFVLQKMPHLRRLTLLLPYLCWRHFVDEIEQSHKVFLSNRYKRWSVRVSEGPSWEFVVPYLDWLKEWATSVEVVAVLCLRRASEYDRSSVPEHIWETMNTETIRRRLEDEDWVPC